MIVVNATITASEETIAAMKPAIAKMEAASQAESGCHDYTFSVELNNPSVLRITERWESMEALAEPTERFFVEQIERQAAADVERDQAD